MQKFIILFSINISFLIITKLRTLELTIVSKISDSMEIVFDKGIFKTEKITRISQAWQEHSM